MLFVWAKALVQHLLPLLGVQELYLICGLPVKLRLEISGLEAGVYTVVVTDEAGCTATCSVTIGSVPAPLVDIACDADPLLSLGGSNSVANATGCNNLDYAFWSSSLLNAYGVDPHWSIVGGSFVENLSGSAIFTGSFVNNDDSNLSFDFNVVFGGRTYSPPAGSPKETGGPCSADVDNTDWYYYTSTTGTLIGTGDLAGAVVNVSRSEPAFQIGTGANENDMIVYGASGWLNVVIVSNPTNGPAFNGGTGHCDFNIELPNGPQLSDEPSCLTICAGESVELFATALPEAGNYAFLWSTGENTASITVSPGSTTNYSVTVTDLDTDCSTTVEVTVTVNDGPEIACSSQDGQCGGLGSASVTVLNEGSFTYAWSNGETTAAIANLADGTYSVVVTDANGCSDECEVTITNEPALAIDCSSTNGECGGLGSASVEVLTGGGDYTYEWSNGGTSASISGLANGSYSVVVTDANGCTDECQVTITNEAALTVQCSEGDDVCPG